MERKNILVFGSSSSGKSSFIRFVDYHLVGSLGIAPTFIKIGFVVDGGGFYSYYMQQGNKLDNEKKIVRKKLCFMHTKSLTHFFNWVQSRLGTIQRLPIWLLF